MSGPRVAVVGAGIVGASIAYHLAVREVAVTLMDAAEPGAGVTHRSFGWLNVAHTDPLPYQALRHGALAEWRRLERALGGAATVDWCGALTWDADPADTERMATHHAAAGYDVHLLSRSEIATVEPGLAVLPTVAAHAPGEGAVDPVAWTRALVAAARRAGALIRTGQRVTGLTMAGERVREVVTAAGDRVPADIVVLAAGMGTVGLAGGIGLDLPVDASPATLLRLGSDRRLVRGIVASPGYEIRHTAGSELLAAESYIDDTPRNGPEAVGRRTAAAVRAGLHGAEAVALIDAAVGWRPMPRDGGPIVGFAPGRPGLYLAVMHAGVVLAPSIGRLAAQEMLDGLEAPTLAACRPVRFDL